MSNKRRFHRIQLSARTNVHHLDNCYEGILGAISLGGAAINFNDSAMIPHGDECALSIVFDETQPPLHLNARIANSSIYRIGVTFINMDVDKEKLLYDSLRKLTHEPVTLDNEFRLFIAIP